MSPSVAPAVQGLATGLIQCLNASCVLSRSANLVPSTDMFTSCGPPRNLDRYAPMRTGLRATGEQVHETATRDRGERNVLVSQVSEAMRCPTVVVPATAAGRRDGHQSTNNTQCASLRIPFPPPAGTHLRHSPIDLYVDGTGRRSETRGNTQRWTAACRPELRRHTETWPAIHGTMVENGSSQPLKIDESVSIHCGGYFRDRMEHRNSGNP